MVTRNRVYLAQTGGACFPSTKYPEKELVILMNGQEACATAMGGRIE